MGTSSEIAITGGRGFLGWHTAVRLRAEGSQDVTLLSRHDFADQGALAARLAGSKTIIHLAGINRAATDHEVEEGNVHIADRLAAALRQNGTPVHVVYGNSIQAHRDNPYGRGKSRAGELLKTAVRALGGTFVDVRLPNIFGEHGRPNYNSFVATFCHEIANGRKPIVQLDRLVPLLHAQDAAAVLIGAAANRNNFALTPDSDPHSVGEVLHMLVDFHEKYMEGQIPALPDKFATDLFNTYRSYTFPDRFPVHATTHSDERGDLFETVRLHGGTGQTFVSATRPGKVRGNHYHLSKIERFFVIRGRAEIALRKVYGDEIIRFRLAGGDRAFVDMPTLWVHNITNIGDDELITMFWADQLFNVAAPDTYWEAVELMESAQ